MAHLSLTPLAVEARLESFADDPTLGQDVSVALCVKDAQQRATTKRVLDRKVAPVVADNGPKIIGGPSPRGFRDGFVALGKFFGEGVTEVNVDDATWTQKHPEVFSIDFAPNGDMVLGGGDSLKFFAAPGNDSSVPPLEVRSPWLRHVHSVCFSPSGRRVLAASTGFDTVLEFDVGEHFGTSEPRVTWQWTAWDNGFSESLLGHHVVRNRIQKERLEREAKANGGEVEVRLVDNPEDYAQRGEDDQIGVPTRWRSVGVNGACYSYSSFVSGCGIPHRDGGVEADAAQLDLSADVLVTFFHKGEAHVVQRYSNHSQLLKDGLKSPHGFRPLPESAVPGSLERVHDVTRIAGILHDRAQTFEVVSSRDGTWSLVDQAGAPIYVLSFEGLPGVCRDESLGEWIQTVNRIDDSLFVAVDQHRSTLWLFDPLRKVRRGIKFSTQLSLHDIRSIPRQWVGFSGTSDSLETRSVTCETFDEPVPFNRALYLGNELSYVAAALRSGRLSGGGVFTHRAQDTLKELLGNKPETVLLTTSCTSALEMATLLCQLRPGDEVILPSYTFVSTANACWLRGAQPVFVDVGLDDINILPEAIERAVTPKTKAIAVVHYAGVGCDMDAIMDISEKYNIPVIEDAAHALGATVSFRGEVRKLGSIGHFGCFSFHETKNLQCGEGGALIVRDKAAAERAWVIWEKGTNRYAFLKGKVDKYSWIDVGSSFLPSEMTAGFLLYHLERLDLILKQRRAVWYAYDAALRPLVGQLQLPNFPETKWTSAHIYFVLLPSKEVADRIINVARSRNIAIYRHYVPLHSAPYGKEISRHVSTSEDQVGLPNTDRIAEVAVRLPMWVGLSQHHIARVIQCVIDGLADK